MVQPRARAVMIAAAASLCVVAVTTRPVTYANEESDWLLAAIVSVVVGEVAIPDVHFEFGSGIKGARVALAWPIPVTLLRIEGNERGASSVVTGLDPELFASGGRPFHFQVQALIEPHYVPSKDLGRLALGGRAAINAARGPLEAFGIYAEGGYVFGDDSDAPLAGGGVGAAWEGFFAFWIGYRASFVDDLRHDLTVNVEFSLPLFALFE